jgi:tetratricopeptide (TPR) repeat protein
MSEALVLGSTSFPAAAPRPLPALPWRDPHSAPPAEVASHIARLEAACLANPRSADLRVCLGLAHAVNYDAYKSMDALEDAIALAPDHFWAQLKLGELHYRLRTLNRAEEETLKAIELAENRWQLAIARKQLQDIRGLLSTCVRNVHWTKPLTVPALALSAMLVLVFVVMLWT